MTKQQYKPKHMSECIDHIKNDKDVPITYSINIKTLSTSKRPLTCCITTIPRLSKQREINQLNYTKSSINKEKTYDIHIKSRENNHQSSIHVPITYSTSIHIPCHPPLTTLRPPIILPSQSSHHHYHYYHHYYHHHHQQQPPSTTIKHKISPRSTSIGSIRPTTTSTTTNTSSELLLPSKKSNKNIQSSLPILSSNSHNKQSTIQQLPSYSTLVWKWFHHTPPKTSTHYNDNQSDYSEIYRHELPRKRNLLCKLFTSPIEKYSKSKHNRLCSNQKHFQSYSSLPNKSNNYNE